MHTQSSLIYHRKKNELKINTFQNQVQGLSESNITTKTYQDIPSSTLFEMKQKRASCMNSSLLASLGIISRS